MIELVNAVITHNRLERLTVIDGKVRLTDSPGYVYVSLLDRRGEWITVGVMKGFGEVDALASTYSLTGDLIVLGRDPVQMARAANHVLAGQGGICVVHQGDMRFDLSLPYWVR